MMGASDDERFEFGLDLFVRGLASYAADASRGYFYWRWASGPLTWSRWHTVGQDRSGGISE